MTDRGATHSPARVPPARLAFWGCQAIGFGIYYVVTVYQMRRSGLALPRPFVEPALSAALGIALTHGLRHLAIRRAWIARDAAFLIPRVIGAGVVLSVVHVHVLWALEAGYYGDKAASPILVTVFAIFRWFMMFGLWSAFYFGFGLLEQRRESELARLQLEKALKVAELRALKSQLHPHFLFNSLNSVRALIPEDPERAAAAVNQLARILRHGLVAGREETVTFARELEAVEDYLALEELRLAERLTVVRDIAADAKSSVVPVMLLQVLVENAIKHGIAELPEGGTLGITAMKEGEALVLVVVNPRPETPPPDDGNSGVGLVNTRERLKLIFGETATLELDLGERQVTARARIPLR